MFGVEAYSSLPDHQADRGDLARQGQARHLRLDPFGDQRIVELPERSGLGSSDGRSTLEQILQIVIVMAIQLTNRDLLLRPLQLPLDVTVLGTAVRFNPKPAVRPELSLGAKAMRCLEDRDDKSRPDRTDRRNPA